MNTTQFLLLVFSVAVLDFIVVLWLRSRFRSSGSTTEASTPGKNAHLLNILKSRESPEKQQSSQSKEQHGLGVEADEEILPHAKPSRNPFAARIASFLKSFLGGKFQLPAGEWIEILIIIVVTFLYAYPILIPHSGLGLPGREYQAHVGSIVLFKQWLAGEIDFPLWNPVLGTGRSLIADPFLFFFNPFLSLPMVIYGVINGSKIAVFLNFFLAGLGAWFLARELKFGRLTRLWCSLLYMMCGAIPAHLTAGHIQLAFALGWLPWSIAGMLWCIHRTSLSSILFASLAQALFFFTGNLYYQIYTLFCLLILGFGYVIDWKQFHFRWAVAKRILLMGVLSLGLISIQFLPELASKSDIRNLGGYLPTETEYHGSQLPENALVNYFVSDLDFSRNTTLNKAPYLQESYRYIGVMPFLLLLFLVPTIQRGHKKEILLFGLCFLFMLAWTDIRFSFIKTLYHILPFLNQFRWPGRALSVGGLFLILISAYCLEYLWDSIRFKRPLLKLQSASGAPGPIPQAFSLFSILIILGLFISLRHVYLKNQELIYLESASAPEIKVGLAYLRSNDPSEFSVFASHGIAIKSALDIYKNHMRSPTITDGWIPAEPPVLLGNLGAITLEPRYWLNWAGEDIDHTNHIFLASIGPMQIWQKQDTYPNAFLVPIQQLLSVDQIPPSEVQPVVSARREGVNRIIVDVKSDQENVLIIAESWFSGWKASIDHDPAEIVSVSKLLAVQIPPGRHVVEFEYSPLAFKVGAPISILTLLLVAGTFLREGLIAAFSPAKTHPDVS